MRSLLKLGGRVVKRAFTSDGGSLSKLKDEFGRVDGIYVMAFSARLICIAIVSWFVFWVSTRLGIATSEFIEMMRGLGL